MTEVHGPLKWDWIIKKVLWNTWRYSHIWKKEHKNRLLLLLLVHTTTTDLVSKRPFFQPTTIPLFSLLLYCHFSAVETPVRLVRIEINPFVCSLFALFVSLSTFFKLKTRRQLLETQTIKMYMSSNVSTFRGRSVVVEVLASPRY